MDTLAIRGPWRARKVLRPRERFMTPGGVTLITDNEANVRMARAELPKLIFRHNGRLITNQAEFRRALELFHDEVKEFCEIPPIEEWDVCRIDYAWQFDFPGLSAQAIMLAHQSLLVPGIRNGPTVFKSEGLTWLSGKTSGLKIMMYDKCKKLRIPGSVLRVEVGLLNSRLLNKLLDGRKWYDWNVLYELFRNVVISIPPIRQPLCVTGWPEAVGAAGLEIEQVDYILACLSASKDKRTIRGYRQRIEATSLGKPFCWCDELPENGPPPAVHVERITGLYGKTPPTQTDLHKVESNPRRHHFNCGTSDVNGAVGATCDRGRTMSVHDGRTFVFKFDHWWEPRRKKGKRPLTFAVGGQQRLMFCFPEFFPAALWIKEFGWRPAINNPLQWFHGEKRVARHERLHGPTRSPNNGQSRQPVIDRWLVNRSAWGNVSEKHGPFRLRDDFQSFSSDVEN